jgi:hypothetical protein
MNVSASSSDYGQIALTASLAKKQQEAQGQSALQLIESAAVSVPQPTPASSSGSSDGRVGSNINISV